MLILAIQRDFELTAIMQRQSVQVLLESTGLMHFLQEYLNTMVPTGEMRRNLGLFKFYWLGKNKNKRFFLQPEILPVVTFIITLINAYSQLISPIFLFPSEIPQTIPWTGGSPCDSPCCDGIRVCEQGHKKLLLMLFFIALADGLAHFTRCISWRTCISHGPY